MKKEWKLKLYYMKQLVKTVKVSQNEITSEKIILNRIPVTIWFEKHIFKTIRAGVVLQPIKELKLDNERKEWHLECTLFEGSNLA